MNAHVPALPYRDPLRKPAMACGALIAVSIAIAAWGKPAGERPLYDTTPVAASVAVRFADGEKGEVIARQAATGAELARFNLGEGGFVRVALRSLTIQRRKRDIGQEEPFVLARLSNGEMVLRDPATGRAVLLSAFGETNAGSFAVLLDKADAAGKATGEAKG